MMYIHYCKKCNRIHMLNGHRTICPICNLLLAELSISYMEYIEMDKDARTSLLTNLSKLTVL